MLFIVDKFVLLRTFAVNQKYSDHDGKNDIRMYRGSFGVSEPGTESVDRYLVAGTV